jgi:hypothetical protein
LQGFFKLQSIKSKNKAVIIIFIILFFAFFSQSTLFLKESNAKITNEQWLTWAGIAWKYFQFGVGVHQTTGISRANLAWYATTDWDTGGYIIAIISAHKLGLISYDEFTNRISKVLSFLKNRELTTKDGIQGWPYWAYYWHNGMPNTEGRLYTDAVDSGRLLYALDLLRKYDGRFENDVLYIFNRSKSAYDVMQAQLSPWYYGYIAAKGFIAFGYDKSSLIYDFENWKGSFIDVYEQSLPAVKTTSEPIILGIIELGVKGNFFEFGRRVYEVQKSRWSSTGKLTGWSEGNYQNPPGYIYEWIIDPSVNPPTWVIKSHDGTIMNVDPLMYVKVAFAYTAIYGENEYTLTLLNVAKNIYNSNYGFGEAVFENGTSAKSLWPVEEAFYSDKTNQMILTSAVYALTLSFSDYPFMFIDSSSMVSVNVVIGASHDHYPCGRAHTIDVVGSNLILSSFIPYANAVNVTSMMDHIQAAYWDGSKIVLKVEGNIITAGGPPVNYVWRYYNDKKVLSAYFNPLGTVYIPSNNHKYSMVNDYYQGKPVTDYAILELYKDGDRNILLVAGISGFATYYASKWLAEKTIDGTIRNYNAKAIILKLYDQDGDPLTTPPEITIIETIQ